MLLVGAVVICLSGSSRASEWRVVRFGDDLVAGVAYWPTLLGATVAITAWAL